MRKKGVRGKDGEEGARERKREDAATLREITKRGKATKAKNKGSLGRNTARQDNPTHELAKLAC